MLTVDFFGLIVFDSLSSCRAYCSASCSEPALSRGRERTLLTTIELLTHVDDTMTTKKCAPHIEMADNYQQKTLRLALPARCVESSSAIEKWLLALWQSSAKQLHPVLFHHAPISLEYVSDQNEVALQVHLHHAGHAASSLAMLPALFSGIDIEERADDPEFEGPGLGALAEFRLRSPGWVDLKKETAPDSANAIIQALAAIPFDASAIVQLLLTPAWMTTEDGRQPAFWLSGRIVASARSEFEAKRIVSVVASSFGQFGAFNGVRTGPVRRMTASHLRAVRQRSLSSVLPLTNVVTPAQIASMYHPPTDSSELPALLVSSCRRTPAPASAGGVVVGEGRNAGGRPQPVRLQPEDLTRHAVVVGPSGSGKTTFLAHLARELMSAGHGVTVIDPHHSLVRDLARTLPAKREQDAALISFADAEHPISLNPLRVAPGHEFVAADELVELVERVYGHQYWGPLLDLLLRHAALAAMELGGSLLESARLLDDSWFREQALAKIENHETVRILSQLAPGSGFDRRLLPAINRLQRLVGTPWLRNIVGQKERALDFAQVFDERRIALFDLSGVGTTNARLLGSLLMLLIKQATLARPLDDRPPPHHFVLVDEASWFLSSTIGELFDQARKFNIGIVLAVQRVGQLSPEPIREAVLSNAGTLLTFRIHDHDDATQLARHLASERIDVRDLHHLPRYEAYMQMTRDGERLEPAWLRAPAPTVESSLSLEHRLIAAARARYARPRAVVEAELRARDESLIEDVEPEIRTLAPPVTILAHAA